MHVTNQYKVTTKNIRMSQMLTLINFSNIGKSNVINAYQLVSVRWTLKCTQSTTQGNTLTE